MKKGFIFDVDGVIAETPHEDAWKESFQLFLDTDNTLQAFARTTGYRTEKFTSALYRELISGKPRLDGARAALAFFGLPDPDGKLAMRYAEMKQDLFLKKIEHGEFKVYDDALLLLFEAKRNGIQIVAASSSKNATRILDEIKVSEFAREHHVVLETLNTDTSLLQLFDGNVCGMDVVKGKPHPGIFLKAAESVKLPRGDCLVVEDAVAGVLAAKAAHMFCVGIARLNNEQELRDAQADIVTSDLRKVFKLLFGV